MDQKTIPQWWCPAASAPELVAAFAARGEIEVAEYPSANGLPVLLGG
jgi:hypothetical protein